MTNSECCDAPLLNYNDGLGICSDCKEWAGQHKDETMIVRRTSILSGKTTEREMPVTQEQLDRHRNGELIQDVFYMLSDEDREFIVSGITSEEWDKLYKGEDE